MQWIDAPADEYAPPQSLFAKDFVKDYKIVKHMIIAVVLIYCSSTAGEVLRTWVNYKINASTNDNMYIQVIKHNIFFDISTVKMIDVSIGLLLSIYRAAEAINISMDVIFNFDTNP